MTPVKTQCSLAGQLYAVPLIQPDLRREEAIQQVADALQYLQNISGDIFSRISRRVELSRRQLQAISERVSLAQAKIEKIKGSKKAIKVFSSAKYPAPEHLQEYGSIFTGALDPGLQRRPRYRIQSKHRPLDERALQEKLKYFPVCVNTKSEPEDEAEEGLGGLPSNISSISSLLLFNKLVMRRKGISGKGPSTGTSEGPGGAFSRMSDSIPPLPPPQQPAGDEDEEDWES